MQHHWNMNKRMECIRWFLPFLAVFNWSENRKSVRWKNTVASVSNIFFNFPSITNWYTWNLVSRSSKILPTCDKIIGFLWTIILRHGSFVRTNPVYGKALLSPTVTSNVSITINDRSICPVSKGKSKCSQIIRRIKDLRGILTLNWGTDLSDWSSVARSSTRLFFVNHLMLELFRISPYLFI